jgi:uncharacterized protein YecE (DUF72 family)
MEQRQAEYLIGTGGWEHESFDECLYPEHGMPSLEKLQYYSRFFDLVEIRPTFWDDSLGPRDADGWISAVRENRQFRFSVKLHSSFTHRKEISPDLTRRIRGLLQELYRENRLAALLIQFPYSFTNTGTHRRHLRKLGELFSGFQAHVEVRNESWTPKALIATLAECGLHPVSTDLPALRHFPPFLTETLGESTYVRLHGRNEKGWLLNGMDSRYDYLYNTKEIREIVRKIRHLASTSRSLLLSCNNTTAGKAIANALQLTATLHGQKRILLPERARTAFPSLEPLGATLEGSHPLLSEEGYRQAM